MIAKIILIVVIVFAAYLIIENKFVLCVRQEICHEGADGVKIVHISDLHKRRFGRDNCRISQLVRRQSPDLIFITGDLVSRTESDFSSVQRLMRELCGIAPVYMCLGNHEQSLPPEKLMELTAAVASAGAVLLRNESVSAVLNGRSFAICGFEPDYKTYKNEDGGGHYEGLKSVEASDIRSALGDRPEGCTLLLAHNPLAADAYAGWGADYTLSGHVHGGVVRLFGVGLLSPERKFFPKYTKGVYSVGGTTLLVSAGLGKLRVFDPPEIVVYMV